jgi:hypothetical protein
MMERKLEAGPGPGPDIYGNPKNTGCKQGVILSYLLTQCNTAKPVIMSNKSCISSKGGGKSCL